MTENCRKVIKYIQQTHRLLYPDEKERVLGDAVHLLEFIPDRFPSELDTGAAHDELYEMYDQLQSDNDSTEYRNPDFIPLRELL